jgi:hypothetical protein
MLLNIPALAALACALLFAQAASPRHVRGSPTRPRAASQIGEDQLHLPGGVRAGPRAVGRQATRQGVVARARAPQRRQVRPSNTVTQCSYDPAFGGSPNAIFQASNWQNVSPPKLAAGQSWAVWTSAIDGRRRC